MAPSEPPAKRHKPAARVEAGLAELVKGYNTANPFQFRGKILAWRPYTDKKTSAGLTLVGPGDTKREVALRGKYIKAVTFETGQQIIFYGDGALIEPTPEQGASKWQDYRVAFLRGVRGKFLDEDGDEIAGAGGYFEYGRVAASASEPSASTSTDDLSAEPPSQDRVYQNALDIPDPSPSTSAEQQRQPTASAGSSRASTSQQSPPVPVSAPPVKPSGSRGVKKAVKAAKLENAAQRVEWGLKTGKRTYMSIKALKDSDARGKCSLIVIATHESITGKVGKSLTGDHRCQFKFVDPTSPDQYLTANLFGKTGTAADLPLVSRGSIVVFQAVNRGPQEVQYDQVTGYKGTTGMHFAVLEPDALLSDSVKPDLGAKTPHAKFGMDEIAYAKDLAHWWRTHEGEVTESSAPVVNAVRDAKEISLEVAKKGAGGSSGRPLLKIEDVEPLNFCDIIAVIVKKYVSTVPGDGANTTLYVSDYTENSLLMDYASDGNWKGPCGQRTLQVTLWNENHLAAAKLNVQDVVYLRNVRPKYAGKGLLEGTMYGDRKHPNKPDIRMLRHDEIQGKYRDVVDQMKARKEAYFGTAGNALAPVFNMSNMPAMPHSPAAQPLDLDKTLALATAPAAATAPPRGPSVRCTLPRTAPDSIEAMRLDTTEDFTWKLRGQVVDYHPARLQDWIVATCPVCETDLPDACITCLDHHQVRLGYMFFLAVAEEPSAANGYTSPCDWITILPSSLADDTSNIFPGLPPTASMRAGESDINLLRDRLGPVLGNIPEKKRRKQEIDVEDYGVAFDFAARRTPDRVGIMRNRLEATTFVE